MVTFIINSTTFYYKLRTPVFKAFSPFSLFRTAA